MGPNFLLRIGTHAEVEPYALRRGTHDGIIINGNLLEATPGATATMVANVHYRLKAPYLIDPYTHVFSLDPSFLMSMRKTTGKVALKTTFERLATRFGEPFKSCAGMRALRPDDFGQSKVVDAVARAVVEYQCQRIETQIASDPKVSELLGGWHPRPESVLAPYFLTPISSFDAWLPVNVSLAVAAQSIAKELGYPGAQCVICIESEVLSSSERLATVIAEYLAVDSAGYSIWVSRFSEEHARAEEIDGMRTLVESLAETERPVRNLHAGFFSMALSKLGLLAYSHGVGYGESRNVQPATGGGVPPERYYFPSLRARLKPADAKEVVKALGVGTVEEFYDKVCGCPVCRIVVKDGIEQFNEFFELGPPHIGRDGRARRFPTSESIQRCRYHYLINRRTERTWLSGADLGEVCRDFVRVREDMEAAQVRRVHWEHLPRWTQALQATPQ